SLTGFGLDVMRRSDRQICIRRMITSDSRDKGIDRIVGGFAGVMDLRSRLAVAAFFGCGFGRSATRRLNGRSVRRRRGGRLDYSRVAGDTEAAAVFRRLG